MIPSVVIAQLSDQKAVDIHLVDQPMFFVDPPRPVARKGVPEWLRFTGPIAWGSAGFLDQGMDALKQLYPFRSRDGTRWPLERLSP